MALNFDEASEVSWRETLKEFEEAYEEVFKQYGYSKGEALMLYTMNRMINAIYTLQDIMEEHNG